MLGNWTPINISDIPNLRNTPCRTVREFLRSGADACEVNIAGYSSATNARLTISQAVSRICRGKVSVLKRDNRVFLVRKEGD